MVGIIMGSDSDLPIMQEAIEILESFDIQIEVDIVSAHRTPEKLFDYCNQCAQTRLKSDYCGCWWRCTFARNGGSYESVTHYWCSRKKSATPSMAGTLFCLFYKCQEEFLLRPLH